MLSIGSSGPICLAQPVIPCREFEIVLWPERRTYAFFHALSEQVAPDLRLPFEYWWDEGAFPPGTEIKDGWEALPELVRRESERCAAQEKANRNPG